MKKVAVALLCLSLLLTSCSMPDQEKSDDPKSEYVYSGNAYLGEYENGNLEQGPYCASCNRPKVDSNGEVSEYGTEGYAGELYFWVCEMCTEKLSESRSPVKVGNEDVYIKAARVWRDPIGYYMAIPFMFDPVDASDFDYEETDTFCIRFDHFENDDSILYLRTDWLGQNIDTASAYGFTYANRDLCDLKALLDLPEGHGLLELPEDYQIIYYEDVPHILSYDYDGEDIICVSVKTIINGVLILRLYFTNYVASYWQADTINEMIYINEDTFPSGEEATAFFARAADDQE